MRVAIFSDVHGNLPALEAVLDHLDSQPDIDLVVFAGDACLFGPRPQECIDVLRNREIDCLVGNTDDWILKFPSVDVDFDDAARKKHLRLGEICQWTRERLDDESLIWLKKLRSCFELRVSPTQSTDDDLLIVHANPRDLLQIIFPREEEQRSLYGCVRQSDEDLNPLLKGVRASTLAYGHLHVPGTRLWRDIRLENISSVSLPGDGDPRAKYAIASWGASRRWEFERFYVDYPVLELVRAFERRKPPGWGKAVESLREHGLVGQVV